MLTRLRVGLALHRVLRLTLSRVLGAGGLILARGRITLLGRVAVLAFRPGLASPEAALGPEGCEVFPASGAGVCGGWLLFSCGAASVIFTSRDTGFAASGPCTLLPCSSTGTNLKEALPLNLLGVQVDTVELGHGDEIALGDGSCRVVVTDFQHRAFIAVFAMDVEDAHTGRRHAIGTFEEGRIQVMVGVMGDAHFLGVAAVVGQVGRLMDGDGLQGRAGDGLLVMVQRLEGEGTPVVLGGIPGDVLEVLEADFTAFFQRGVGVTALVDEQGGFCRVGVSRFIDFPMRMKAGASSATVPLKRSSPRVCLMF